MTDAALIAGCNGAGKTIFARTFVPAAFPDAVFLNADEIQRENRQILSPLEAGRELLKRLEEAVAIQRDFVIETTLSSGQYARRFPVWREKGYLITLIFLEVPSAESAIDRVARGVANGGHNIPETDIRRRFLCGLEEFRTRYRTSADL